jgi:predicted nucleotidyltransferase
MRLDNDDETVEFPNLAASQRNSLDDLAISAAKQVAGDNLAGVLIFGSAVTGERDELSDLDVLCITRELQSISKHSFTRGEADIDMHFVSELQARNAISPDQWKDNYILLALKTGYIVTDCGSLCPLQEAAHVLWTHGPSLIKRDKIASFTDGARMLQGAARKLGSRLEKLATKNQLQSEVAFAEMHLSSILQSICNMYARAHRLWAFPPWVVRSVNEPPYIQLAEKIEQILSRSTPPDRSKMIVDMAEEALNALHIPSQSDRDGNSGHHNY